MRPRGLPGRLRTVRVHRVVSVEATGGGAHERSPPRGMALTVRFAESRKSGASRMHVDIDNLHPGHGTGGDADVRGRPP